MKISGPFSKPRPAPEPRVEGRDRSGEGQLVGQRIRPGGSNGNNVLVGNTLRRDGFEPSGQGTRAGNLRIGSGHSDNISKGPGGDEGAASTVPAGSLHTLKLRLSGAKPGGRKEPLGGNEPPPSSGPILGERGGRERTNFLTKDVLESLNRPELTDKVINKLTKAKTLEKLAKLTLRLPPDLRDTVMYLASFRPGSSNANNILV